MQKADTAAGNGGVAVPEANSDTYSIARSLSKSNAGAAARSVPSVQSDTVASCVPGMSDPGPPAAIDIRGDYYWNRGRNRLRRASAALCGCPRLKFRHCAECHIV